MNNRNILFIILICTVLTLCACSNTTPELAEADASVTQTNTTEPTQTPTPSTKTTSEPSPEATPTPEPVETTAPEPSESPAPTPTPTPSYNYIGQAVCTANEYVNIREEATTSSDILDTLPAGETADVVEHTGNWVHIVYNGTDGYVSADYTVAIHRPSIDVPTGDWATILVNPWHYLPDNFTVELADFEGGQVDARILEIATAMFTDAKADGVDFQLVDAYRSYETQSAQYEKKVQQYIAKGYSREDAEVQAATITARPNTSEHQTGLALDIVTPSYTARDSGFANTKAFKWLNANAHYYGFTLRYIKGKEDITGVIYESWHWRFVGTEAAIAMKESGQCYEEYLGIID